MGRKRRNAVHGFFSYDKTRNESSCSIQGCVVKVKGLHTTNLLYHLSSKHPTEYHIVLRRNAITQEPDASSSSSHASHHAISPSNKRKINKIDNLLEECVNLVAVHGRPFSLINDRAFQNIISMIIEPTELSAVNSRSIRELLIKKADAERQVISTKLRNKLISIKIDGATRQDRSFLGVNVQFVENAQIKLIHLGVIQLNSRSTTEYLKEKLIYVLRKYYISISQIITITTDNGANYLKVSKLINEEIEEASNEDDDEDRSDEENESVPPNFQSISLEENDINSTYSVQSVRCAAHTLQLAVSDALRENDAVDVIEAARRIVHHLRTPSLRQVLRSANKRKAILDCLTRWHSTIDMLERLRDLRDCCSTNEGDTLYVSNNTWIAIDDLIRSLMPAKLLTKILQQEQLTIGDFYYHWTKCILETESIMVPLAQHLCQAMKTRQKNLMETPYFVSALFMDPRFQVVLSDQEILTALAYLESVWCQIIRLHSKNQISNAENDQNLSNQNNSIDVDTVDTDNDMMEKLLLATERSKQTQNVEGRQINNIYMLLKEFNNYPRIKSKENILQFWETKKTSDPQLYQLAVTILAIPSTQVSVERLFSSLKFILSDLRYNLSESIVEDILVLRHSTNK